MSKNNVLNSDIVDLNFLNENFGEDYSAYAQMIVFFLDQSEEKVQLLLESVKNHDFDTIKSTAHFLKSSFGIMGLKCKDFLIEMEILSINKSDFDKILHLSKLVELDFTESVIEYQRILSIVSEDQK
ncbi:MAG: Hpt domain-containing protein [Flavobacteriia bacterium]|nr:Hpt domain-containing protein [Flavobacteriia bacterium]OIP47872.1 MAG: hypothetical protein AUK46_03540 [Flavobacteriaceae bacterium CG2_30_31_66]PIV97237.1 MAG: hypothetical protein COW43_04230 [Flavobacteriaceae bacterium CG17_big_fil_post_rev_8_21_14_2_50_31_13]PIX15160.1 MAG: hypothetical protein COZ74_00910 [Flavobacteriaceae bacterium CG_4_8_14_3_um_filter_31_8]PIY15911.1 MAG: hypothetical protein COZ16_02520 [Flavobacteriaceae bacterium CG_4_10_14_3_um_filter_31_253]PIZ12306.1 MAG: 